MAVPPNVQKHSTISKPVLVTCIAALVAWRLIVGASPSRGDEAAALAETTPTLAERDQLYERAQKLAAEGDLTEALEIARQMLAVDVRLFGEIHDDVAGGCDIVAGYLERLDRYPEAIDARSKQLEILTALHGADDWRVTDARLAIAFSHRKSKLTDDERGELAAADEKLSLVMELQSQGRSADAISPARECLAVHRRILGEAHIATAQSLNNLAYLLNSRGDYAAARPYYEQALAINKKVLGEAHPHTAKSLNNLACLLMDTGADAAALPYYEQALAINEKVLGEEHPDTATSLNNLGALHVSMGDYAAARPYYEQGLAINKKVLGEEHPDTATSLNNLGYLFHSMGDYAAARPYYEQGVAIHKKVLGEEHPDTAMSLNNLGLLLQQMGDYAAARRHYDRALAINKNVLGEKHPNTASTLDNLGTLLADTGEFAAARPYHEQALAIRKQLLGEEHPDTAMSLNSLGVLLDSMGDYAGARSYYEQALAIRNKVLGEDHPDTAMSVGNLAILSAAEEEWPTAINGVVEATRIDQRSLENIFSTATETRMRAHLRTISADLDRVLSLPLAQFGREADGLTWVLRRKAIVFEALCRLRAAQWLAAADPKFAEVQSAIVAAQQQLDDMTLQPPAGVAPEELAATWATLQTQIAELQDKLQAALSTRLGHEWSLMTTIDAVRAQLPADAALVELVKYAPYNFQDKVQNRRWGAPRYVAFVLHADAKRPVELIELGEAAAIDEAVAGLGRHHKEVQRAGELADWPALETEYRRLAAPLYKKLFARIVAKLAGVKQVYLSPDSQLHNLPFEALVDASGKYLVEAGYQFAYVNSGRDLVRQRSDESGGGVYVFAGPNYDLGVVQRLAASERLRSAAPNALAANTPTGVELLASATSAPISRSADTRIGWRHLPGADLEGQEAGAAFADAGWGDVHTYTGDDALEDLVKTVRRPKALVLVTHGDFLEDQPELPADTGDSRSFGALDFERGLADNRGGSGQTRARLRATEDPMLRSYLLLAGANEIDEPLPAGSKLDNGWLTAQEISQLDLRGTELVVLSACNTGRGRAENGQAVAGMRSAFLFAGARTIVGSLYEVPNAETRQLLKPFYEGVAAGEGKLASLNAAKLAFIQKRREETGAAHPFYWASFVLVGER